MSRRAALAGVLLAPLVNTSLAAAATPAAPAPAAVRGFDVLEHRFGLSLGAEHVPKLSLELAAWRAEYAVVWQGWGVGVGLSFPLSAQGETLVSLELRRGLLLGPGCLWAAVSLGISRLEQGHQGEQRVVLYHGTASALELSYELGHTASVRPFLALRANLPWYTTEVETLRPLLSEEGALESTGIGYWRAWMPSYGAWVGLAL